MITCGGNYHYKQIVPCGGRKKSQIYSIFSGSFCQIYRVTDEALIAKTVVWPNFFEVLSNDYILYVL